MLVQTVSLSHIKNILGYRYTLRDLDALSVILSLMLKHSDTKWDFSSDIVRAKTCNIWTKPLCIAFQTLATCGIQCE